MAGPIVAKKTAGIRLTLTVTLLMVDPTTDIQATAGGLTATRIMAAIVVGTHTPTGIGERESLTAAQRPV